MAMGHAAGGNCDRSNSLVGAASIAISHLFSSDILRLAGGSNRNLGRFGHTIADSLDSPPRPRRVCSWLCSLGYAFRKKSDDHPGLSHPSWCRQRCSHPQHRKSSASKMNWGVFFEKNSGNFINSMCSLSMEYALTLYG